MEIVVSKEELARGVNTVNKAVPGKTTMPILECILFDATDGKIKLTANDMEMAVETSVDGDTAEYGKAAIDARMLTELVKKLPDSDVTIKTDSTTALIRCDKVKANIPIRNGEDYPAIPAVQRGLAVTISQFSLRDIIRQTIFSADESNVNKLMGGELFEISGSSLKVVALDGHRIATRSLELRGDFGNQKVVIPAKTLNEISRILNGGVNDEVSIYLTGNHALFEFAGTTVVTRLIDGDYFDTAKMTNMESTTQVRINKREFLESIDRSTLFVSNMDKKPVIVDITDDRLEWSVKTMSGGMTEDLEIKKSGEDIKIGFNPRFLIDALRAIDDEEITLHLITPKMPCIIKDDKNSYLYLILPVNFA